jgi:hypothetical protein
MTWVRSTIYPGLQRPTNIERAGKGGGGLVLGKRIVLASCGRLTRGLRPEEVNEDENGIRTTGCSPCCGSALVRIRDAFTRAPLRRATYCASRRGRDEDLYSNDFIE